MRAIPNMVVLNPCDELQTRAALAAASKYEGPCYIRLGRLATPAVYKAEQPFVIGKTYELKSGTDFVIFATGYMVHIGLEVAEQLKDKYSIKVVDVPSIKPLNEADILANISGMKAIVTLEEHTTIGGLGSVIKEKIALKDPKKVLSIGIEDTFGESGKPNELLEKYGLTTAKIITKLEEHDAIFN